MLSDTHSRHQKLAVPDGDLLIVAGDVSSHGHLDEVRDFDRFLGRLPHRHKVVIAGNHDFCFEREPLSARALITNATYLEDEGCCVDGIQIWGSPWQPWFHDWAFNLPRGAALREKWDLIPVDVDVLVTHGPPHGFGDLCYDGRRVGCEELLVRVRELQPRLHCFGHIHEGYGVYHDGDTVLVNASTCNLRYHPVNPPVVLDI